MPRIILCIIAGIVATAQTAIADSDGYYCAAPGMLAYEISMSEHPDAVPTPTKEGLAGHRLYLVFYGDAGIEDMIWVDLPAFQTHGMRCSNEAVILLGWDKVHIVALDPRHQPRLLAPVARLTREPIAGFVSDNLGTHYPGFGTGYEKVEPVWLPAPAGSTTRFRLALYERKAEACEVDFETFLEQIGPDGSTIVSRRQLIRAEKGLECG